MFLNGFRSANPRPSKLAQEPGSQGLRCSSSAVHVPKPRKPQDMRNAPIRLREITASSYVRNLNAGVI
jgi:hypothetical protein